MKKICCICYEEGSNMKINCCGKHFHTDCLQKWLKKKPTCPMCRQFCAHEIQPKTMREQQQKLLSILMEISKVKPGCEEKEELMFASFFQSLCHPLTKTLFQNFPKYKLMFQLKLFYNYNEYENSAYLRKCLRKAFRYLFNSRVTIVN